MTLITIKERSWLVSCSVKTGGTGVARFRNVHNLNNTLVIIWEDNMFFTGTY